MSEEELSVLRAQLDDLLEKGWIRPSSSPYGAPVLFVRKKNKDLRLCIDYRKLNAQTVKNAGPLPRIDDFLKRLGSAKFFSKLDLKSGYHQLEIRPEDRYKTAFKTRYGHFKWLVMPFGLTNAPTTFQAAMTLEFRHMLDRFVLIYLDDMLVYSRSLDEHVEHLRTVLERLRQAKYKANRDKCEFARQELEYLGHYVTPQGIRPLADKIEAIRVQSQEGSGADRKIFENAHCLRTFYLDLHVVKRTLPFRCPLTVGGEGLGRLWNMGEQARCSDFGGGDVGMACVDALESGSSRVDDDVLDGHWDHKMGDAQGEEHLDGGHAPHDGSSGDAICSVPPEEEHVGRQDSQKETKGNAAMDFALPNSSGTTSSAGLTKYGEGQQDVRHGVDGNVLVTSRPTNRGESACNATPTPINNAKMVADEGDEHTIVQLLKRMPRKVQMSIALFIWICGIHLNIMIIALILWYIRRPIGISLLCVYLTLILIPVSEPSAWARSLTRFVCSTVVQYFPIKVKIAENASFDPNRAYVIGLEPHSVLPLATVALSPVLRNSPVPKIRLLGTSMLKYVPIIRHVWTWMGVHDVSRETFVKLLSDGYSCTLVPGGVQECLYMEKGKEVIFLRARRGFLRIAISTGSPVVPAYCFRQSYAFSFWAPKAKWFQRLARAIHYVPMIYWGVMCSPIPWPGEMLVVVGKPIEVPHVKDPTPDQVLAVQTKFIKAMEDLYEEYKREGRMGDVPLVVM
ncbi:hypothetical protein CBR_g8007 [Chara braunii]|uniref:Reverse transcriptase domain-containing protein n=1 Tax=Chara braunii TaxID=69332 RepID=A0A388KL38_CHABU|nr:hypothetical protein CBR_g8007 [Chara braunii]|eukprot:GBG70708.1 hypothetical protein CBR_g8007 [Chara braunii]